MESIQLSVCKFSIQARVDARLSSAPTPQGLTATPTGPGEGVKPQRLRGPSAFAMMQVQAREGQALLATLEAAGSFSNLMRLGFRPLSSGAARDYISVVLLFSHLACGNLL